ncbi:MAG: dephospho-CoA kinase [Candidatus Omnitrophica bacterium]|nr:dephospho-CoA kinase [Candidatus Omnitrophota bacterium]
MGKKKLIIGLTGGFCAGKTTVSALFSRFGAKVLDADEFAHMALNQPRIKQRIIKLLGDGIVSRGRIDRKKVRQLVFNDKALLMKLSSAIHPYVKKAMKEYAGRCRSEVVVWDVPLLIESGMHRSVDAVVLVACGRQEQFRRARRRGIKRGEALKIINSQMPFSKKRRLADFIINNNTGLDNTEKQARAVFNRLTGGITGGKNRKG